MSDLEIFQAKIAQAWTPPPPPPRPVQIVTAREPQIVEVYNPANSKPRATTYQDLSSQPGIPQLHQAIDLSQPQVRGTQPLTPVGGDRGTRPLDPADAWLNDIPLPDLAPTEPAKPKRSAIELVNSARLKTDGTPPAPAANSSSDSSLGGLVGSLLGSVLGGDASALGGLVSNLLGGLFSSGKATADASADSRSEFAPYEDKNAALGELYREVEQQDPGHSWKKELESQLARGMVGLGEAQKLSAKEVQQARAILAAACQGATPEQVEVIHYQLESELSYGHIRAQDEHGRTGLDYLMDVVEADALSPQFAGTSQAEVVRQLLGNASHPGMITQGENTLDCALATMEAGFARTDKTDFLRVASELAIHGVATLKGGQDGPVAIDLSTMDPANQAGRRIVDFAMQSALRGLTGQTPDKGLTTAQADLVHDAIFGEGFTTFTGASILPAVMTLVSNPEFIDRLINGKGTDGKVTMRDNGVLHSMEVTRMRLDGVELWDPETDKVYRLPLDVFFTHVERIWLPSQYLGGLASTSSGPEAEGGGRVATSSARG